ncbi:MAG: penicillin-binding protein activator [Desulfohalobiaceae bacterium]
MQPAPEQESEAEQIQQSAEQAWQEDRLHKAIDLYQELLQLQITEEQKLEAWQRLARAALQTEQPQLAAKALRSWADLDSQARQGWAWNSLLVDYLELTGQSQEMQDRLRQLLDQESFGPKVQRAALDRLSGYYLEKGLLQELRSAWEQVYSQQEQEEGRRELEQELRKLLQDLDPELWPELGREIMRMDQSRFPGGLLQWEYYLQGLRQERLSWLQVGPALQELLAESRLLISPELRSELQELRQDLGPARLGVALLLPLDGDYRQISRSILAGVDAALWQMQDKAPELEVRVINTSRSQWLQEVQDLPDDFQLAGGPLRGSVWQELADSTQPEKRAFFAFRPKLSQGQEGSLAYRFFPGPKDQVQALLNVLKREIGVQDYGVFYPQGDYGRRMSRAFWDQVQERGAEIRAMASYPSRKQSSWKQEVADFLEVPEKLRDPAKDRKQKDLGLLSPETEFRAVFLPDSLEQARMMIPEFFYYDARSLIFLGTALWSQGWEDIPQLDKDFFSLALMPGAWLPESSNSAQQSLQDALQELLQGEPDFWAGLGYDFLRFVHQMPLDLEPDQRRALNAYLAKEKDFAWSMAPLSWDQEGRASQDLYVLQVGQQGLEPLQAEDFRSRWQLQRRQEIQRRARYIKQEALQQ